MRIAIISTPHIPTPPRGYGASEVIAGLIAEGLERRGHQVRLFACSGSTARVTEIWSYPEVRLATSFDQRELIQVTRALHDAADCDLIHNHCLSTGPALAHLAPRPFLTTLHYVHPIVEAFPEAPYIAISDRQRAQLSEKNVVARVYNGIDLRQFPLSNEREDYLLFLGRFHPNKGADLAIEVARQSGRKLVIAAPEPPEDKRDWFESQVQPHLHGSIKWIGPVEGEERARLLGRAAATLLPLRWDEPFGLVMVESMACGTPPIAIRRGAAPELILPGVTGFLVDDIPGMIAAVEQATMIDPLRCRRHVEENFSAERMVDEYERLFQSYARSG